MSEDRRVSEPEAVEVAIVGGGCAGVAAAFELTRPEHRGKYRVTIYQVGWRLGGKGASGRGPADRIEEHGLHLWLGFYENAFRLLREGYAELGRDPARCRIADWRDAFYPDPVVGITERSGSGAWKHWLAHFPPGVGNPGDPIHEHDPFTVESYLRRAAELLRTLLASAQDRIQAAPEDGDPRPGRAREPSQRAVGETIARFLKYGQFLTLAALVEGARLLELALGTLARHPERLALGLVDALAAGARRELESLIEDDDELRRIWVIVDLVLAFIRGSIRFGLATDPRGLDAIDDYDCREWLRLNGASERSVDSAFVRGLYDLALAYEDGDPGRPRLGAGGGLRGALRMFFTYRGALFWKMRSGMGDVVFAPFYEVLRRRGVRFRFFHRLENVKLAAAESLAPGERPYVEALEFDVQAEVAGGGEYQPLVDVRGLPCWSSKPDCSQLEGGERFEEEGRDFECHWDRRKVATKTLRVVEDFDFVVLAVGLGAVPHVCREILDRDPRWRTMVERVKTVATQSFQVWMSAGMEELGWSGPPVNLSGFVKPFDTWADMRQLLPEESWRREPRAIAYFCSTLPDPPATEPSPAERHELVRRNAVRFLNLDVKDLWPNALDRSGRFRWELLVDPDEEPGTDAAARRGEARFDSQYWRANVNPTDRYVLSVPGSAEHRISPLDNTYDNLTVAGDWTDNGHNEACVEAAVMSGRLAAHAISGSPELEDIVGFDHP